MIELVVIITIIGVLALVAVPRWIGGDSFDSRGFYDKSAAIVRAAQKSSVAWRTNVFVCVTATQVSVGTANNCAPPITNPVTSAPMSETAPTGVTLNAVTFGFDGLGRPVSGAGAILAAATTISLTSTIPGDPARQIVVQPQTGHVVAN